MSNLPKFITRHLHAVYIPVNTYSIVVIVTQLKTKIALQMSQPYSLESSEKHHEIVPTGIGGQLPNLGFGYGEAKIAKTPKTWLWQQLL